MKRERSSFVVFLASFALAFSIHCSRSTASDRVDRIVVAGKCIDESGAVIGGAKVKLFRWHHQDRSIANVDLVNAMKTADDGRFRFADVRAPSEDSGASETITFYLVTTHPQLATAVTFVDHDRPTENVEIMLKRAGQLDGVVTDDQGLPVAGAVVYRPSLGSEPVDGVWSDVTDSKGRFAIKDLPEWTRRDEQAKPAGQRITASHFYVIHPKYGRKHGSYSQIPATVDIELEPGAIVVGTVIGAVTGQPAARTTVQAQGIKQRGWGETQTDSQGHYQLSSLVADQYNIWAAAPERTVKAIDSLALAAGETTTAPDLQLVSGGFITGRILHFETEKPVLRTSDGLRLRVGLYGPSRPKSGAAIESVVVADDGSYRIRVAPGENRPYVPMFGLMKRTSRTVPFNVGEGETVELDFYVNPQREPPAQ